MLFEIDPRSLVMRPVPLRPADLPLHFLSGLSRSADLLRHLPGDAVPELLGDAPTCLVGSVIVDGNHFDVIKVKR